MATTLGCASAADVMVPARDARALVVLEEQASGPFARRLAPRFVLFDDNTVFVSDGDLASARVGRISDREARGLLDTVDAALRELPHALVLSRYAHQTAAVMYRRTGRGWVRKVVGGFRPPLVVGFSTCTPRAFLAIYRRLTRYRIPDGRPWTGPRPADDWTEARVINRSPPVPPSEWGCATDPQHPRDLDPPGRLAPGIPE